MEQLDKHAKQGRAAAAVIGAPEREGDREAFNSARRAVINFGDELLRFDTPFLPAPSFPPSVMFFLQAADPSLARPPPHWQPERIETLINKTAAAPPLSPDPFPFLVMAASAFFCRLMPQ